MQEPGGSAARQPAKVADGNAPHHRHHAQVVNGVGWGAGTSFFFFNLFSRSSNFSLSSVFFSPEAP